MRQEPQAQGGTHEPAGPAGAGGEGGRAGGQTLFPVQAPTRQRIHQVGPTPQTAKAPRLGQTVLAPKLQADEGGPRCSSCRQRPGVQALVPGPPLCVRSSDPPAQAACGPGRGPVSCLPLISGTSFEGQSCCFRGANPEGGHRLPPQGGSLRRAVPGHHPVRVQEPHFTVAKGGSEQTAVLTKPTSQLRGLAHRVTRTPHRWHLPQRKLSVSSDNRMRRFCTRLRIRSVRIAFSASRGGRRPRLLTSLSFFPFFPPPRPPSPVAPPTHPPPTDLSLFPSDPGLYFRTRACHSTRIWSFPRGVPTGCTRCLGH